MKKKILSLLIIVMFLSTTTICYARIEQLTNKFDDPPRDIVWPFNSPNIADWLGANINAGDHSGRIESVEDTNGDGQVGYCDNIVVNWRSSNLRQPYYKYHCEKRTYVDDPSDPDYGRYKFELDYKSKSRNPPKFSSCCHYVDDDNTGGPWDGSYQYPYHNIQDAVDAANTGDHVYVLPGSYTENIILDKSIVLSHDLDFYNENVDVFGGNSGSTITINADHCTVVGILVRGNSDWEDSAGIKCYSSYNTVYGCEITENVNGIYLLDSASNNKIIENDIHANDFNFFVGSDPFDNLIYHNKFYDPNFFNAKDLGSNYWDNGENGNYWDDYDGPDIDEDGIGDEPYPIQGNLNYDNYPLKNETILKNGKPIIDIFDGPDSGETGIDYGYAVMFYDDEYHDAILEIDWDDESPIEYSGYWGAGEEYTFYHNWSNEGTYNIKVRAIDVLGEESEWEPIEVSVPRSKGFPYLLLQFFLEKICDIFPWMEMLLD